MDTAILLDAINKIKVQHDEDMERSRMFGRLEANLSNADQIFHEGRLTALREVAKEIGSPSVINQHEAIEYLNRLIAIEESKQPAGQPVENVKSGFVNGSGRTIRSGAPVYLDQEERLNPKPSRAVGGPVPEGQKYVVDEGCHLLFRAPFGGQRVQVIFSNGVGAVSPEVEENR